TDGPPPSSATVGAPYRFTYTASGSPAPTFNLTAGALPPGLTLSPAGLLAGTPTATGTFAGTVTASNGASTAATQRFTITVNQAPDFASPADATCMVGVPGSFTITPVGFPQVALSTTGTFPSGVTFVDNHNGTATLSGTPATGTGGTYVVTVTAANDVAP